jgi:hypothetical protein
LASFELPDLSLFDEDEDDDEEEAVRVLEEDPADRVFVASYEETIPSTSKVLSKSETLVAPGISLEITSTFVSLVYLA